MVTRPPRTGSSGPGISARSTLPKRISSRSQSGSSGCRISGAANPSLGIDCSGLVQLALCAAGLQAPRDSDMQERRARRCGRHRRRAPARRSRLLARPCRHHAGRALAAACQRACHGGLVRAAGRCPGADPGGDRRATSAPCGASRSSAGEAASVSRPAGRAAGGRGKSARTSRRSVDEGRGAVIGGRLRPCRAVAAAALPMAPDGDTSCAVQPKPIGCVTRSQVNSCSIATLVGTKSSALSMRTSSGRNVSISDVSTSPAWMPCARSCAEKACSG